MRVGLRLYTYYPFFNGAFMFVLGIFGMGVGMPMGMGMGMRNLGHEIDFTGVFVVRGTRITI